MAGFKGIAAACPKSRDKREENGRKLVFMSFPERRSDSKQLNRGATKRKKRGTEKNRCNQVNERQGSLIQYLLPRLFS